MSRLLQRRPTDEATHSAPVSELAACEVVPARYPGRVVAALLVLLLIGLFVADAATNPAWDWPTFRAYVFEKSIMNALLMTIELAVIATVLGFAGGVVVALMRMSGNPVLTATGWGFVWFFRSVPLVVQLLLWGNLSFLYPDIRFALPFGPVLYEQPTSTLLSAFAAAVIGLSLHQAAYSAEIVRSGLLSVDQGQVEAAHSLGIPPLRQLRRIVLPQAMRTIIPTAANETISLIKTTAVVFVLALGDLFYRVQVIYGLNGRIVPLLMVATFWYIVLVTVLSIGQFYVERYFARGATRNLPPTPLMKLRSQLTRKG